jgi:hypothetical protein
MGGREMKLAIALCALLVGCANQETMLRNAAGETRYCYLVHDSTLAKIPAVGEYNKCLNNAGTDGFKRIVQ